MASLTYTATDEYGNDIIVRLPDWTGQPLLATTATPPDGTLVADGSEASRASYPELFAKIGTTYGAGDGVNTFNLPDWRDEFPRFSGTERAVGSKQSDAIRNITGHLGGNSSYVFMNRAANPGAGSYTDGVFSASVGTVKGSWCPSATVAEGQTPNDALATMDVSTQVPTADENRPRNVAFLPCIIYV